MKTIDVTAQFSSVVIVYLCTCFTFGELKHDNYTEYQSSVQS